MDRLEDMDDLKVAVRRLVAAEPRFSVIVEHHGLPPLRHAEPGLPSLLRIVTDQLISLKAGESIWARLTTQFGSFLPEDIMAVSQDGLRTLGLSVAKSRTFHAAARAFAAGDFEENLQLSDAELYHRLTGISGIGPWTASIYLLMTRRAADAWPAADLALQHAAKDLLGLGERPSSRRMVVLAEAWRPYRSAAALLLWQHYRSLRAIAPDRRRVFTGSPHEIY
jgi:DNA-3-methyladenine glycosylase II